MQKQQVGLDAGVSITIASIKGGAMAIALNSQKPVRENAASVDRFLQDQDTVAMTNIFLI